MSDIHICPPGFPVLAAGWLSGIRRLQSMHRGFYRPIGQPPPAESPTMMWIKSLSDDGQCWINLLQHDPLLLKVRMQVES